MAAISIVLSAFVLAPIAGSTSVTSGLRGQVTIYPARPVCIEGESCSKPASEALLVFSRNGRVAAKVTTGRLGWYRVLLGPGAYTVTAPRYRRGPGLTPRNVRVPKGRVARIDLEIDTGIQ